MDKNKKVFLIGIGMGSRSNVSKEAETIIKKADILIGAKRMTEFFEQRAKQFISYKPKEIKEYLEQSEQWNTAAVLLSGDSGFYSGAKGLVEVLSDTQYEISLLPGISSVSYLSSKTGISWEDMYLTSAHGREENLIGRVRSHEKTFALLNGGAQLKELCEKFLYYGMTDLKLFAGENLSYPTERIVVGTPEKIVQEEFASLISVIILNPNPRNYFSEIKEEEFIRGNVPMTKSEVRTVSISKMKLEESGVVYDIGAGTGSVSIEIAVKHPGIKIYSIEKNPEAVFLIEQNKKKFQADNVKIIEGEALEILKTQELDVPTHVFIGGSGGNLEEIIKLLLEKNEKVQITVNAVSLNSITEIFHIIEAMELQSEIVSLNVSKSKKMGKYHMMTANNPVYIITVRR